MKKTLLSFVIRYSLFVIPLIGFSQCPTTPITLSSQADVDAFTTNYPNCTEMNNTLTISGADIFDLAPLSVITSLKDGLVINNCSSLSNLNGLNFVTDFEETFNDGLFITNNALLTSISALSNITNLNNISNGFSLIISNNPVLISLDGLQGFNDDYNYLTIFNNDALVDLTGLSNEIFVAEVFRIQDNDALQSFNGIVNFGASELQIYNNPLLNDVSAFNGNSFPSFLNITNNPSLALCDNEVFCSAIQELNLSDASQYPLFLVENNAEGCNSVAQIAYSCESVPFNDECDKALEVNINESIQAYNEFGTQSPQTPSCNDTNRVDVWFTFNSATLSFVDISVDADYSMQLWEGTCTNLTQVANVCGSNMLNDVAVTPNTDYYLQVWSDGTGRRATGLFEVLVQDTTLSVAENNFEGFSIYPNPVNDLLNFKSVKTIDELQVYNLLGQNVMTTKPQTAQTELDMSGLGSGMYILKVRIGNETASYKIVKE